MLSKWGKSVSSVCCRTGRAHILNGNKVVACEREIDRERKKERKRGREGGRERKRERSIYNNRDKRRDVEENFFESGLSQFTVVKPNRKKILWIFYNCGSVSSDLPLLCALLFSLFSPPYGLACSPQRTVKLHLLSSLLLY